MLDAALRLTRLRRQLPRPEELRRRRRAAGISLAALGEEIGVTGVTILNWETGRRMPRDPEVLARYLKILERLDREGTQ